MLVILVMLVMERPIRIPARTHYDTLDDYIAQINAFEYSSPSFDAFKAILNSPIEPYHLEQCILWYNCYDQTLHHRESEWSTSVKRARNERYVIDSDKEAARRAELATAAETHRYNEDLASRGNVQGPLTDEQRKQNRDLFLMREHPEEYARNQAAEAKAKATKKKTFFHRFFGKGTRRK
jgi:hypothetical protein